MNCPNGHGAMEEKKINRTIPFKGMIVDIVEEAFVCPTCNLCAGTIQTAGKIQITIMAARQKQGEVNATQKRRS